MPGPFAPSFQTTYIQSMPVPASFLGVSAETDVSKVALALFAAVYAGCFLMVSNHYVFRPKVEQFLEQWSQSGAGRQLLIDLVTNLPLLTFLACTLGVSNSDSGLSVIVFSDIGWSGLYVGVLAFRGGQRKEVGNWKLMLIKSISFLGLVYASIAMHYLTHSYFVSLGVILLFVYFFNLTIDSHEQKFVVIMQYLFNYKPQNQAENQYQHNHKMVTADYLARNFPVSSEQLNEKMRSYEKQARSIKLKTKSVVAQKLMRVALAVHLSKQKLEAKAKRDIRNYYGTFNGTVAQKSRKLIIDKAATHEQFESQSDLRVDVDQAHQEVDSCIFYIFPVKLFESNKFLSLAFSLVINVAFGILLALTLFITDNLTLGQYFHLLYGLLLLPLLPSASKSDFFSSMSLSALWKYCLYGIMLCFNCISNGSTLFSNLNLSGTLSFSAVIQLFAICILTYMLVRVQHSNYRLLFVWMAVVILNVILIFKFCQ